MLKGRPYLILICITAGLGGFLFGFDTAVISGAVNFLRTQFNLSPAMEGWMMSSALLGCLMGAAIAGYLADKYGRKKGIANLCVSFSCLFHRVYGCRSSLCFGYCKNCRWNRSWFCGNGSPIVYRRIVTGQFKGPTCFSLSIIYYFRHLMFVSVEFIFITICT